MTDSKTEETVETKIEKRGYPLSILQMEGNVMLDVKFQMDKNFYSIMCELAERFAMLQSILSNSLITQDTKNQTIEQSFNKEDLQIFTQAMTNLIHTISFQLGQAGVIEEMTAEEFEVKLKGLHDQVATKVKEAINEPKGTS